MRASSSDPSMSACMCWPLCCMVDSVSRIQPSPGVQVLEQDLWHRAQPRMLLSGERSSCVMPAT